VKMRRARALSIIAAVVLITVGLDAPAGSVDGEDTRVGQRIKLVLSERTPAYLGRTPVLRPDGSPPVPQLTTAASAPLANVLGDRFAGAWDVPTATGSQPTVAVKGRTASDIAAIRRIVPGAEVVDAKHSLIDLNRHRDEALALLDSLGSFSSHAILDAPRNAIELRVDLGDGVSGEAAAQISELAASDVVAVQTTTIRQLNYPNATWGGERFYSPTGACTTGFAIRNGFGNFMTSAAHCFSGQNVEVFGSNGPNGPRVTPAVSRVWTWEPLGQVRGDFAAWPSAGAEGYLNAANLRVRGWANPSWLEQVCFWGATSNRQKCSAVSATDVIVTQNHPVTEAFERRFPGFCVRGFEAEQGIGGDSGSAMYLRPTVAGETWARGIVSGSDPGNELVSGDAITCGTAIGTVLNAYGATLLVK
jgi:hypothetical protein